MEGKRLQDVEREPTTEPEAFESGAADGVTGDQHSRRAHRKAAPAA